MNVLVTYATKHNSTAEIAAALGEEIRSAGFPVDVLPVTDVDDLVPYDAVVLGSAVYMGSWLNEAAKFLKNYEEDLAERYVWLFSSGPTGEGNPYELLEGWNFPVNLEEIADRVGPREVKLFSGRLNSDQLGWSERMIYRLVKAPTGDYRNWDTIRGWARQIATVLANVSTPVGG